MPKNPHYRRSARDGSFGALPARFRRLRLLVVGAGDVGARLIQMLYERFGERVAVVAITRRAEQAQRLRTSNAQCLAVDLDQPRALRRLRGFGRRMIDLAPPPAAGGDDPRTRNLIAALSRSIRRRESPSKHPATSSTWVYASTTGVYGDAQGARFDETRTTAPDSDRARRRVAAERRLRRTGRNSRVRTVITRVPGIYAHDRLPIERLQKQLPALRPDEDVYTNHIHADDLARILWIAMFRGRRNRVYHAVDNSDLKMGDYFDAVADALNLPRAPRRSRAEVAQRVSPAMMSFMQESRRLSNRRLLTELRVRLRYPTVRDALAAQR